MTPDSHDTKDILLDAALTHVAFDGWTDATFRAAIADTKIDPVLAQSACPRGGVDLALAFHARGDQQMVARMNATDMSEMKIREKVASAVRWRIEAISDKEAVRRGMALFALPQYAADGARAIWDTCDLIWNTLGDYSGDFNWYTKRATLSGVYSSTLLFWLGDDSPEHQATWDFLDRRIENIMQFEKFKAQVNNNPLLKPLMAGPNWLLGQIKPPKHPDDLNLPGMMTPPR